MFDTFNDVFRKLLGRGNSFKQTAKGRRPTTRKLRFEGLERREMMAGNVAAAMSGHDLYISGTNNSSGVEVLQLAPGMFEVLGVTDGGSATKVGGKAYEIFTGVTGGVHINMSGANDFIEVGNLNMPTLKIGSDLTINAGDHATVGVLNTAVGGNVSINAGAKDDTVLVDAINVKGNLGIVTGSGNDTVVGLYSTVGKTASIQTNAGNDYVGLAFNAADQFFADLGAGDDVLEVRNNHVNSKVTLNGGAGNDQLIDPNNTFPNQLRYDTGFEKLGS